MGKRRAVFLDRDGVLIEDVDYVRRVGQVRLLPGAAEAVRAVNEAGLAAIVASNQSGVGRGYFSLVKMRAIDRRFRALLARRGAGLDAVYYCPHLPDAGCACRKPGTALLERARRRLGLDLEGSFFIGDSSTDTLTARNAGCTAILVRTGKGGKDGKSKAKPDVTVADVGAAVRWILKRIKRRR